MIKNNFLIKEFEKRNLIYKKYQKNNFIITKVNFLKKINLNDKSFKYIFDLKDNICTKNILTTAGSKILNNFYPSYNATVYQKLIDNNYILFSKSNMDELGEGGRGENLFFGNVINPINKNYVIGGSTAGGAGLVATKIVDFSIGTDTGDSIRVPAAICGIIGFKPSWGRISRYGIIPYSPSLDTVGILSRSLILTAKVYDLLKGYDPKDLTSINEIENNSYKSINDFNLDKKQIIVIKNIYEKILNNNYKIHFDNLLNKLKANNAKIVFKNFDEKLLNVSQLVYKVISNSESISCLSNLTGLTFGNRKDGDNWKEVFTNTRTNGFSEKVKARFILGLISADNENQKKIVNKAKKIRTLFINEYNKLFENENDLILNPVMDNGPDKIHVTRIAKKNKNFLIDHLVICNFVGCPSLTIPIGHINKNMPVSISISSKYKMDNICLQFGHYVEKLVKFKNKIYE